MKKPILFFALAATLIFTSCKNDDDGDSKICESCTVLGSTGKLCDNGDGTVTESVEGEPDTTASGEDLEGLTPTEALAEYKRECEFYNTIL